MGEMPSTSAACDAAVIGGSFMPLGGQNLIEALAVGAPVVVARACSTSRKRRALRWRSAAASRFQMPVRRSALRSICLRITLAASGWARRERGSARRIAERPSGI